MGVIGSLGKLFLSAKNAIGLVKTATLGMNTAFLASPITWVIAGIVALVAAFVVLWNKSEAFRGFWIGLFEQVLHAGMADIEACPTKSRSEVHGAVSGGAANP